MSYIETNYFKKYEYNLLMETFLSNLLLRKDIFIYHVMWTPI